LRKGPPGKDERKRVFQRGERAWRRWVGGGPVRRGFAGAIWIKVDGGGL
jgi:hypothetical protein